ncbi:MAG: cation:proton antiporter [Oscillospiraceae bacterium]
MFYRYLLDIALILLATKLLGLLTRRVQMPQVVGALLAGLILGPACLNVLQGTEFLHQISELGVIVIMFTAGMGTDLNELKKSGKGGFVVALCGVVVPLIMGTALAFAFNRGELAAPGNPIIQDVFVGVILTATSVSITVETLKEMGKLTTGVGNTILAAALIDDILGLIALTIITSVGGGEANVPLVLLKIVAFFGFVLVAGFLYSKFFRWYEDKLGDKDLHRWPLSAFVLCLLLAYCAEEFFGVADIIGAFAAGLIIGTTPKATYIESRFSPLSYLLLTPIFFASIGLNVTLPPMTLQLVLFAVLLVLVAVLSKLIGCGLGARVCGFRGRQCVQMGLGMACRGEVALIVANKGMATGMLPPAFFGPVIIVVVCCAMLTPIMLKIAFKSDGKHADMAESGLVDKYNAVEQLDYVADRVLGADKKLRDDGTTTDQTEQK